MRAWILALMRAWIWILALMRAWILADARVCGVLEGHAVSAQGDRCQCLCLQAQFVCAWIFESERQARDACTCEIVDQSLAPDFCLVAESLGL